METKQTVMDVHQLAQLKMAGVVLIMVRLLIHALPFVVMVLFLELKYVMTIILAMEMGKLNS